MDFDFKLDMTQSFEMKEVATLKPKGNADCVLIARNGVYRSSYIANVMEHGSDINDLTDSGSEGN